MNFPWERRGEGHQRAFVLGLLRLGKCFPAPAWSMHDKGEKAVGPEEVDSRDGARVEALGAWAGAGAEGQGHRSMNSPKSFSRSALLMFGGKSGRCSRQNSWYGLAFATW